MQKAKQPLVNKRTFLMYTSIFLVLAGIIFLLFVLTGKSFIHEGDGFHQHYPFFKEYLQMLRDFVATGNWQSWDWSINVGADTLLTYGYYVVGDPFVYLGLLFPQGTEEFAFHFIMLVRIWAVGASFLAYARHMKMTHWSVLPASVLYGFSHYVIYNVVRHPFFIHPMIWFPLIAIGIEKVLDKKSGTFFAFMIAISAISNFYFFYMLTLLAFFYALIRYLTGDFKRTWLAFGQLLLRFIGYYLLGLMLAAVVFLPQVYGFLKASRSTGLPPISMLLYPTDYYGLLLLNVITPGTKYWTVGGFSVLAILPLPLLVRKRKEKPDLFWALLLLAIMVLFPIFGSIMNGLSSPYNRFTFVFPFYLALVLVYFLEHIGEMKAQDIRWMKWLMIVFTLLYSVTSYFMFNAFLYFSPVMIGWVGYYLATLTQKHSFQSATVGKVAVGLVALNMSMNALNFYTPLGKNAMCATEDYGTIDEAYTDVFSGVEAKLPQDEWYRIGVSSMDNQVRNHYSHLDVMGLNSYASLTSGYVSDFSMLLENSQYQVIQPLRNGIDDRRVANQALGVRYIITHPDHIQYLPPSYRINQELSNREEEVLVAETPYAAPFAYVVNQAVTLDEVEEMHPVQRESLLEEAVILEEHTNLDPVSVPPTVLTHHGSGTCFSGIHMPQEWSLNEALSLEVTEKNSILVFHFDDPDKFINQEVFLYIEGIQFEPPEKELGLEQNTAFRINAHFNAQTKSVLQSNKYSFSSYFKRENMLIHLNRVSQAEITMGLEFDHIGQYHFDKISVVSRPYNEADIAAFAERRQEKALELEVFENEYVKGQVTGEGGMLVTSIPYSSGWTALVDGVEVETERVNVGFIGLPINSGEHTVEFVYQTPFLFTGAILTLLGLIGIVIIRRK